MKMFIVYYAKVRYVVRAHREASARNKVEQHLNVKLTPEEKHYMMVLDIPKHEQDHLIVPYKLLEPLDITSIVKGTFVAVLRQA